MQPGLRSLACPGPLAPLVQSMQYCWAAQVGWAGLGNAVLNCVRGLHTEGLFLRGGFGSI